MYKVILTMVWLTFFSVNLINAQKITWSGKAGNNDFFDELNWSDPTSGLSPENGTIDPGIDINLQLEIEGAEIDINASGTIKFGTGSLYIQQTNLKADGIIGGKIVVAQDAYIDLSGATPLTGNPVIQLVSPFCWLRLLQILPADALTNYTGFFLVNGQPAQYPENIRFDNYYASGVVVRQEDSTAKPLAIYSEPSYNGNSTIDIELNKVYSGSLIPEGLDNAVSSFVLKKGFMVTFADNEDGTGLSKVYIASENDLEIASFPNQLNNSISFIRVLPWNWVSKKGIGGNITGLDETWNYAWNNNGNSTIAREYAPMSWGKGGADQDSDIEIYKSKYKATHVLAFNESDNCNDQSGQWGDLCNTDVAVETYRNLMKTGMRLVSPSCRENAPFGWLKEFHDKATDQDIRIDVIGVHWYDWGSNPKNSPNANPENVFNRFKSYLQKVYDLYQLPIWITEFNANLNRTTNVNLEFMKLALPYLEELEYVERYAWFQPNSGVADFYDNQENLTSVGEFYKTFVSTPALKNAVIMAPNNLDEKIISGIADFRSSDENATVRIYPNPVNETLQVVSGMDYGKISIFNINGVPVFSGELRSSIDVSKLQPGVYFIKTGQHILKFIKN